MNKKLNKKAHHLLSQEELDKELLFNCTVRYAGDSELHLARIIYSFLTSSKEQKWGKEKYATKHKLAKSLKNKSQKRLFIRWSAAASILVAMFSGWLILDGIKNNQIVEYAQSVQIFQPDSVTNLFLSDGKKVAIHQEEPTIIYDQSGENITVDSIHKISQKEDVESLAYNTLVVPYGKRTQITLSDGSKVWLNSGSKMVYPANMKEKRNVYIEGEAVFEVTHSANHPFFVKTKDFQIKVLGTVFSVSAYPEDQKSSTVLAEGKIELSVNKMSLFRDQKFVIKPGTMASYSSSSHSFYCQDVDPQSYMSWRDGYFIFKNEYLGNIIKKLERYYNVDIVLIKSDLGGERFSGQLDLKDAPEDIFKVISKTTPIRIDRERNKLIIY